MLIVRWKIAGDDAIPKGNLLFQYRPKCVLMVTNCWLSGSNGSFWWAFFKSSLMIWWLDDLMAVIPPVWHWIVVCNCVFTSCGRPAPETRILHIGFQSSLIRESQFLPKRDGRKPLTTRSGTVTLWFWYLNWTRNWPKLGRSASYRLADRYWRVEVESPWNACCKSPGI